MVFSILAIERISYTYIWEKLGEDWPLIETVTLKDNKGGRDPVSYVTPFDEVIELFFMCGGKLILIWLWLLRHMSSACYCFLSLE